MAATMQYSAAFALQPLKGASGTRQIHDPTDCRHVASTPQRCVWNNLAVPASRLIAEASTPQRCVWNGPRTARGPPRGRFNPSKVRLEPAHVRFAVVVAPASTPQRCVWNRRSPRRSRSSRFRFNPSKVRLERCAGARPASAGCRFNPSKVRLERANAGRRNRAASCFNPSKVRLEPRGCSLSTGAASFNPSKVRLEHGVAVLHPARPVASTPQRCVWNLVDLAHHLAVAIASTPQRCVWNILGYKDEGDYFQLQPLKGASGTRWLSRHDRPHRASTPQRCVWNRRSWRRRPARCIRFNPSKVRLERRPTPATSAPRARFNPSKVRLEPGRHDGHVRSIRASTPQRCVWNSVLTRLSWPV